MAGALADPVDEALFIWKGGSTDLAEEFGARLSLTLSLARSSMSLFQPC